MKVILSPARRFRRCAPDQLPELTRPRYQQQAGMLLEQLRQLSPWQLESLLKVNPELALDAFGWYRDMELNHAGGTAAILAYQGMVYRSLRAETFTRQEFENAQEKLVLCSAFYGPLRPLDGIEPYRLELDSLFRPGDQKLRSFWGDRFYQAAFEDGGPVVDLASKEYSSAVSAFLRPGDRMIECRFLTWKRGKLRTIVTDAKGARGAMARTIIREGWQRPEQLTAFEEGGFQYSPQLSGENLMVFVRHSEG